MQTDSKEYAFYDNLVFFVQYIKISISKTLNSNYRHFLNSEYRDSRSHLLGLNSNEMKIGYG